MYVCIDRRSLIFPYQKKKAYIQTSAQNIFINIYKLFSGNRLPTAGIFNDLLVHIHIYLCIYIHFKV